MKTLPLLPTALTPKVMDRFWAKVARVESGCLEWHAAASPQGYGYFYLAGKLYRSHRVSVTWATQEAIPDGMDVDHLCRNPKCVEPLHLEVVDRRTNIIRSTAKGADAAGGVECQRGHDLMAAGAWAIQPDGSRLCRLCRNIRWVEYNNRKRRPA